MFYVYHIDLKNLQIFLDRGYFVSVSDARWSHKAIGMGSNPMQNQKTFLSFNI